MTVSGSHLRAPKRSVHTAQWKYIRHFDDRINVVLPNCDDGYSKTFWMNNGWKTLPSVAHEELYDLTFDPNEQNNLAVSREQRAHAALEDLRTRLDSWMKETNDPGPGAKSHELLICCNSEYRISCSCLGSCVTSWQFTSSGQCGRQPKCSIKRAANDVVLDSDCRQCSLV